MHPLLKFGELDGVLLELGHQERLGRAVTVCVYKSMLLNSKDRVACQVFDGGTAYDMPKEKAAYGIRLVLRQSALDLTKVKDGLLISLGADTLIHKLKSGERVLDCHSCEIVGQWDDVKNHFSYVVNNPLAQPNPPTEPVYAPPTTEYAPERTAKAPARPPRPEPYAPVKPRASTIQYLKLSDLNTFVDKMRILARVTQKGAIREYTNARGQGKLFNLDIIDADGTEMRCTFFQEAVDKFYETFEEGKVYSFENGSVKLANPRFKKYDHPCEISFGLDAVITPMPEDEMDDKPKLAASIVPRPLKDVPDLNVNDIIDVVAICHRIFPPTVITVRATGAQKEKRNIVIVDDSGYLCDLTLWGSDCGLLPENTLEDCVCDRPADCQCDHNRYFVCLRRCRVDDFNGKRLSASQNGDLKIYLQSAGRWYQMLGGTQGRRELQEAAVPNMETFQQLSEWLDSNTENAVLKKVSNNQPASAGGAQKYHTLKEIQEEASDGATKYFSVCCSILDTNVSLARKYYWNACPSCSKKLVEEGEMYSCQSCQKEYTTPERKYNFQLDLQDATTTLKVSVLGDVGVELLDGRTANDVEAIRTHHEEAFLDLFNQLKRRELIFRIMAKSEVWQDESRVKYRVVGIEKLQDKALEQYIRWQIATTTQLLSLI